MTVADHRRIDEMRPKGRDGFEWPGSLGRRGLAVEAGIHITLDASVRK
jgi:hypothetical protein